MSPIFRMKQLDINNLETQEGKDVKFFFESKITELYHEYYEYQSLYNAIHKLPLFRDKFNDYENKLTDNDLTIKKLQDEITRLQSDVFRDRFDKYEKELKDCFFAYNQGLDSRFNWRFNTDDYSYEELFLIFKKKVNDIGWKLDEKVKKKWFEDKMDFFKFYGRDIETLLAKVKIAHGRRVFCLPIEKKMIISLKDLNKGYDMFLDNNEVKSRKDTTSKDILNQMYC